ncbi:DUF1972 domain-containing protein [Paraburkholderia piptadeniae]|nr:DUF1972 domain-containing protein [Paraburkholderia piptadeniae]
MSLKQISILGTRGIPANHGGFETFAERLALYLTKRGWKVTVYCQGGIGQSETIEDIWHGVNRIVIPVSRAGALGTIEFDWNSVRNVVSRRPTLVLTLGYNTAIFCTYLRWHGITNLINMDGLEWRRDKWKFHEQVWLWLNERIGCWSGNHLIADHPAIATHLATRVKRRKITTIPYGADAVGDVDRSSLDVLGLEGAVYGLVIARPEPENSVLDIVTAFSRRPRDAKLVVLGKYDPDTHSYHREVLDAASEEVLFPGAIYDKTVLCALRRHAHFYAHGHRVGGTNPSLVEALGAGSAVIAHDNVFNRWVAGPEAKFFTTEADCDLHISALLADPATARAMSLASTQRFESAFRWDSVLAQYEALLDRHLDGAERRSPIQPVSVPVAAEHTAAFDLRVPAASGDSGMVNAESMKMLETKVD